MREELSIFRFIEAYAKQKASGNGLFNYLDQGMNLRSMQLIALALAGTLQIGKKTTSDKRDVQIIFNHDRYTDEEAEYDLALLLQLTLLEKHPNNGEKIQGSTVFKSISYEENSFSFTWNPEMHPRDLDTDKVFTLADIDIVKQFKNQQSWILYDYLINIASSSSIDMEKIHWMRLLGVDGVESYRNNTAEFKERVWNKAINEINNLTGMGLWYTEQHSGNRITGFTLHCPAENQKTG